MLLAVSVQSKPEEWSLPLLDPDIPDNEEKPEISEDYPLEYDYEYLYDVAPDNDGDADFPGIELQNVEVGGKRTDFVNKLNHKIF